MVPTRSTSVQTMVPPAPWEEQLLSQFSEHVEGEGGLLREYADLASRSPEDVRYLINMILEDETRHHRLFQEMLNRVRSDVDFRDYDPKVPYLQNKPAHRADLLEATERFLEFEREDEKSLKKLRKDLRPMKDTTLFSLLVEVMELDTRKHIAILDFIRRTATKPW